jgi:hypothetical protein
MTSDDVHNLLLTEIGDQWDRSNLHGVDLRRCLMRPEVIVAVDAVDESDVEVWLVLLNHPDTRLGYGVAYDEKSGKFGLLQFVEGYAPCLLGLYGGFLDALDAM